MKTSFHHRRLKYQNAFTLIELLVSMAVLMVLSLAIVRIVGLTSDSIRVTGKRMDATAQKRLALGWIGSDMESRIKRTDLLPVFSKAAGNDSFRFYSEALSYKGTREITIIGYRVNESPATDQAAFVLERGSAGSDWSGSNTVHFSETLPDIAPAGYQLLADGIFRMEFCYLKTDGSLSNSAAADWTDVTAVLVAVAVLDPFSRNLVSDSQLGDLARSLPDSQEGGDPLTGWQAAYSADGFGGDTPEPAIQAIRFSQRYFYVR